MRPVFEYSDYRKFLQDYYEWAKGNKRGFSHRAFLAKAGMSGPNYLKRVMEGVHNLTDHSIPKFAAALELGQLEAEYFRHLVYFNQARTLEDKDREFHRLMALKSEGRSPASRLLLEKAQYDYYSDWFNVAIRETLAFFDYRGNAAALGKALSPTIPPKQVRRAIALLERLGLAERRPDGALRPTSAFVLTDPDIQSLLIPKFHLAMAKLAAGAITRFPKEERYFSSSTVSVSAATYGAIIGIIRECRKEILRKVAEDPGPDRVYHVNFQLFPLTASKLGRKRRKGKS